MVDKYVYENISRKVPLYPVNKGCYRCKLKKGCYRCKLKLQECLKYEMQGGMKLIKWKVIYILILTTNYI